MYNAHSYIDTEKSLIYSALIGTHVSWIQTLLMIQISLSYYLLEQFH